MSDSLTIYLSESSVVEIERECIRHFHLGPGVVAQRMALWSKFHLVNEMPVGEGGYLFFIPNDRVGYISWNLAENGILSYPTVQVTEDFSELKLPIGVTWERTAETMSEEDLSTRAVA